MAAVIKAVSAITYAGSLFGLFAIFWRDDSRKYCYSRGDGSSGVRRRCAREYPSLVVCGLLAWRHPIFRSAYF